MYWAVIQSLKYDQSMYKIMGEELKKSVEL